MLVHLYKGKGDIMECENYCRNKLMSHTIKFWVRESNRRKKVTIAEQQFGFILQPEQVVFSTNLFFKINFLFPLVTGELLQNTVDVTSETYKLYNIKI